MPRRSATLNSAGRISSVSAGRLTTISAQQRNRLSVRISTTVATSSMRCHLPMTSAAAIHPPPAMSGVVQLEHHTAHPADSGIPTCEVPDRELRFSASRANRSRTASHRRRQDFLG
ncbi:hypothetical protein DAPPUDRAFT_238191 [Daphnia pulex]|uniref:Uncharacterized protein n=1 Tax=Daphnia pulex TaxID=6669 RepID=E9G5R4_DAPPU|nr:hypothetical protein DAPPUDRAFT_238191 [Daphnia pulex]|eukprot:EFX85127.1 hypothetical protein DAPPUDRAFT_238191 [Daphnia pulex]